MLSVKFYTKNLVKNHKNSHQEKENHLSNRIVKNWQKFVEIMLRNNITYHSNGYENNPTT